MTEKKYSNEHPSPRRRHPRFVLLGTGLAALFVLGLFYLGAKPFAVNLFPEPWDKLAHLVAYGAIATAIALIYDGRRPWLVIIAVSLIGFTDEWHQATLPGRSASLDDLFADVFAAICAAFICQYLGRQRRTVGTEVPSATSIRHPLNMPK